MQFGLNRDEMLSLQGLYSCEDPPKAYYLARVSTLDSTVTIFNNIAGENT